MIVKSDLGKVVKYDVKIDFTDNNQDAKIRFPVHEGRSKCMVRNPIER